MNLFPCVRFLIVQILLKMPWILTYRDFQIDATINGLISAIKVSISSFLLVKNYENKECRFVFFCRNPNLGKMSKSADNIDMSGHLSSYSFNNTYTTPPPKLSVNNFLLEQKSKNHQFLLCVRILTGRKGQKFY